jgi:anti-sigma regulatory factor (Ser/Thr protein kinase)
VRRRLARDKKQAGVTRKFLRTLLQELPEFDVDNCELVVSELVANAILNTKAPEVWVEFSINGDRLMIIVSNDLVEQVAVQIEAKKQPSDSLNGRGLLIVEALAAEWGYWQSEDHKRLTVWAAMEADMGESRGVTSEAAAPPLPTRNGADVGQIGTPGKVVRRGELSEADVSAMRATLERLPPDLRRRVAEPGSEDEGR